MDTYKQLITVFSQNANVDNACKMQQYMKDITIFYGIPTPLRRDLTKPFIAQAKKSKTIDWQLLDLCYKDQHRECQYFVLDYLLALKKYLKISDIDKLRAYILDKSWWDTSDVLCKIIGFMSIDNQNLKQLMLKWSTDDNLWIRRVAILHQLGLKNKTDTKLLATIIKNNCGSNEFFINKAIGWALRDYSKINPMWVREFIKKNFNSLASLSIKEASKYI